MLRSQVSESRSFNKFRTGPGAPGYVLEAPGVEAGLGADSAGFDSAAGFDSVAGLLSAAESAAGFSIELDEALGA